MKNGYRSKKAIKAACLGVGLAIAAWGTGAGTAMAAQALPTYQLSGSITPTTDLVDVYVFYGMNSSSFPNPSLISDYYIPSIAANTTQDFSFSIADDPANGNYWQEGYTVVARYDANADGVADGVTVGMNASKGQEALGREWTDYFYTSEEDVQGWLATQDTNQLRDFFGGNFFSWDGLIAGSGTPLSLINFSTGTYGGSALAATSQVPLPGSIWLLLSSGIGASIVRKVKRPRARA